MKQKLPGWILTGILAGAMVVLDGKIFASKLLPVKFGAAITIFLVLLLAVAAFLNRTTAKKYDSPQVSY